VPNIQDIANQANAKLDTLIANTADIVAETAKLEPKIDLTNSRLQQIDATLAAGFSNLGGGLFAILEVERATLAAELQQIRQNDTIICLLENADTLLCGITRKLNLQLALSERIALASERIEGISERAHCCEAGDYDRDQKRKAQIEQCCPPPAPPIEACPESCPKHPFTPGEPKGQNWKPLPSRRKAEGQG